MDSFDLPALRALDAAHHLHPFCDNAALAKRGTRILTRGEGVYVWDQDGNKLLDAFAGLWCVNIGYGRKELGRAAAEQMERLCYYNSFFQCTTEPTVKLSAKLAELAPGDLNYAFFTNSGSEANDTILRLVRHFWAVQGKPEKNIFIGRHNGYHGSTVAGASLGGMQGMHKQGGLPIPNIHHINSPYWFGEGGDMDPDEFGRERARELERKILELGPERVAAFIGEPIQGAAGVFIPPKTYWPEINRICKQYDVLLIPDEVICGFGRTGEWFAVEHEKVTPDLICLGKALTGGFPLSACVGSAELMDRAWPASTGEAIHTSTFLGHPVGCAMALANISELDRRALVKRSREVGEELMAQLRSLRSRSCVMPVRGRGLMVGLELNLPDGKPATAQCLGLIKRLLHRGFIFLPEGEHANVLAFTPPLIVTTAQLGAAVRAVQEELEATP
ncbi:MAG TPA: aminotransferase [Methylomirabilota bacterium]|nr:aminotransferase [Methylomirabilota bacterium]